MSSSPPHRSSSEPLSSRTQSRAVSGLPHALTSFIGRDRELAAVTGLLRQNDVRLLTVTGPGGVGKTRLALEAAHRMVETDAFEVRFVDLAPLPSASLVLPTIAHVLGASDADDQMLVQRVATILSDRPFILLLDNFEHLLSAAPRITDLLVACPHLTILVTSRTRLRLSGERIFPVAPFSVPTASHVIDDQAIKGSDAVRLFVARTQQVDPSFALTEANVATVAEVCRRLDGLPLALELAAARSDILPPQMLLARLGQRLPLLTGGPRDQPARLQTMRQAIGWSLDLMSEDEQTLFRRLSVFAGGCTLQAAAMVTEKAESDLLQDVAFLAEKNLVRLVPQEDGELRIQMLETVREFGLDQLAEQGDEAATRDRHAAWCLSLSQQAHSGIMGANQRRWVERLEREHPNLRAALTWLSDRGEITSALRVANGLFVFWFLRGYLREGAAWIERLLPQAEDVEPSDHVWALFGSGFLLWAQGNFIEAEQAARQGLALAQQHGLINGTALSLCLLHDALAMLGKHQEAMERGLQAVQSMRQAENRVWLAYVLCDVGSTLANVGEPRQGMALVEEGLAIHRALGNKQGIGNTLSDLGFDALDRGDLTTGAQHLSESLRQLWESGDSWYLANPLEGIATIAVEIGQFARAAHLIGAASYLRERSGGHRWPEERTHVDGAIANAREALDEASFQRELAQGRAMLLDDIIDEAISAAEDFLHEAWPADPRPSSDECELTSRELDVLRLLAMGKSNPEIADSLFISRGTVRTHVSNILGKLGASSRTEAAAIAHRRNLC